MQDSVAVSWEQSNYINNIEALTRIRGRTTSNLSDPGCRSKDESVAALAGPRCSLLRAGQNSLRRVAWLASYVLLLLTITLFLECAVGGFSLCLGVANLDGLGQGLVIGHAGLAIVENGVANRSAEARDEVRELPLVWWRVELVVDVDFGVAIIVRPAHGVDGFGARGLVIGVGDVEVDEWIVDEVRVKEIGG